MKNHESILQGHCVKWFRYQYPQFIIFAVPNGGHRHKLTAINLKREGALAGIPDLVIILPFKIFFIEMKHDKGKLTDNQKEVIPKIQLLGHTVYVCNNFDLFQEIIRNEVANIPTL